jgi:hypothetical protein
LTPAFHFQILDNFFDVFNKNAEILCEQLAKVTGNSNNGELAEDVDVFPFLKKCTLDIICGNSQTVVLIATSNRGPYRIITGNFFFLIIIFVFVYRGCNGHYGQCSATRFGVY